MMIEAGCFTIKRPIAQLSLALTGVELRMLAALAKVVPLDSTSVDGRFRPEADFGAGRQIDVDHNEKIQSARKWKKLRH